MDSEELTAALRDAGLSPYQASAYVTVLELDDATATAVVAECSVPRPRIYDVLAELADRGYVETYEREHLRVRAREPEAVVADLRERATAFETAAEEIKRQWERPAPSGHAIDVFSGADAVVRHAREAITDATSAVQIAASADRFDRLLSAIREAADGGAAVKLSLSVPDDDELPPLERAFGDRQIEVRRRTSPAPFLALVDGEATYLAVETGSEYGTYVNDAALTSMLYWYFQFALWESWPEVYAGDGRTPGSYAEIRQCIRDLAPRLEHGERPRATVDGIEVATGDRRELRGTVVDVRHPRRPDEEPDDGALVTGQATLTLETDDGTHTVGGFGAIVEDLRATRIRVADPD